jgi:SAM-dependent methyltransferase
MMTMSSYDEIASEYYLERHITSRNFDAATLNSRLLIKRYLPLDGLVLDLGAGRGRAEEYLGIRHSRITEIDLSEKMLHLTPRGKSHDRIQSDALNLPFNSSSFSVVAAFLYDPYNKPALYQEISRVLSPGGVFLGTLPHYEWGKMLRKIRGYEFEVARFVKSTGGYATLSSFLMNDLTLKQELTQAKMEVIMMESLCLPQNIEKISPDIVAPAGLFGLDPKSLPIVKLIVARRQ